jgi:enoyl-[acyl-carrier-protein] reductase (NADH)
MDKKLYTITLNEAEYQELQLFFTGAEVVFQGHVDLFNKYLEKSGQELSTQQAYQLGVSKAQSFRKLFEAIKPTLKLPSSEQ